MKILINDGIVPQGEKMLIEAGFEVDLNTIPQENLAAELNNYDAILVRSATKVRKEHIDAAPNLKLIGRGGVGMDNIDVEYARSKGIKVVNTPAASSRSVAELAIAHLFALTRFVNISNVSMRAGKWDKKIYKGIEVGDKVLGLVGIGRIGQETAKMAMALGMTVIAYDAFINESPLEGVEIVSMDELLTRSDFISLHIPFDKAKGATIAKNEFDKMKNGVYLINCARGGTVCEKSLLEALNSGKVAKAGIDVFEEEPTKNMELINHPNVSVTPHIGAQTKEAQLRVGTEIAETVIRELK